MLKISVVVPSYNQGKFIEETILSILDQNYPNIEIFIMDGGSTDNTVDVIKKYESRLTNWISEKDKGQSDAINKGFSKCTGDIISWLCSDDLYTPNALQKVNDVFNQLPEKVGVVHGDSELFRGKNVVRYDRGYPDLNLERLLAGMAFPQPSSFMRRSALLQSGDVNDKLHFGMDFDLFSRMSMICDFHYDPFLYSRYRLHEASKSTTSIYKFIQEWSIVFNSIIEGMGQQNNIDVLKKFNLKTEPDSSIRNFFTQHKNNKNPDSKKMLFYFLINVITYDYATTNFSRVSKIGTFLQENYKDYLAFEPRTLKEIKRSQNLPSFFLKFARNFKRSLMQE